MLISTVKKIYDEYDKPCTFNELYNNVYTDKFKDDMMTHFKPKGKFSNLFMSKEEAAPLLKKEVVVKIKNPRGRPKKIII